MKFEGSKSRRGLKKALAIIGALSVGATLLVSALQMNTASAAATHQGCKSLKVPQYFDNGAHYYTHYDPQPNDAPDRANAIVCTRGDITAVGGDLSKSPNAPDTAPGGGGAPAPTGKVYKGCGKTVDPWFFADGNDNGIPSPHYYTAAPAADNSNAKECTQEQVDAAGGNPAWKGDKNPDNGTVNPVVGGGVNPQGTDTDSQRAQGGSRTNPWPANTGLKPFPNGCKSEPSAGTTIRVWKYLGGGDATKAGWYECDCKQIQGAVPPGQCTNPTAAPADAEQGGSSDQVTVQRASSVVFNAVKASPKVSIRKSKLTDACPPGYTVKDSDRVSLPVDAAHPLDGWSAPNNGNWCNLVNWQIFLAGSQGMLKSQGKDAAIAELNRFATAAGVSARVTG